jgi:ADP-heptose:LPS heptosyltransferase
LEKIVFFGHKIDQYRNILVDLPHGLGDQIMCLPLLKSLKKKYPDAKITVFTPNENSSELFKYVQCVDSYKFIDIKFTKFGVVRFFFKNFLSLRKYIKNNDFDLYVAPHYNPVRELFVRIFPFPVAVLNKEYAHKIKGVENVLECLGIETDYDYALENVCASEVLEKFGLEKNSYIVLDRYPQHVQLDPRGWFYFNELITRLKAERYKVVLAGLNDNHVKLEGVVNLVNETKFSELLGVLQGAQLVVSLDSGIFHFSYSLNTPVIGLFGPVDPSSRLPKLKKNVYALYKKVQCSPCIKNRVDIRCNNYESPYLCMKSISVDEVMEKIKEVMRNGI